MLVVMAEVLIQDRVQVPWRDSSLLVGVALSQTALARLLGMHQPAIARLKADDHQPSLATLSRLARVLSLEFHIDIAPDAFELRDTA
jgi:DNA-binding XRE family transcriptional regulator